RARGMATGLPGSRTIAPPAPRGPLRRRGRGADGEPRLLACRGCRGDGTPEAAPPAVAPVRARSVLCGCDTCARGELRCRRATPTPRSRGAIGARSWLARDHEGRT